MRFADSSNSFGKEAGNDGLPMPLVPPVSKARFPVNSRGSRSRMTIFGLLIPQNNGYDGAKPSMAITQEKGPLPTVEENEAYFKTAS